VERNSWISLLCNFGIIADHGQKCQTSTGIHGFHAESQHSYDKIEQEAVSFIAPRNNAGLSIFYRYFIYLPSGKHTNITMERSTMLLMGKSTISTGPWLQVRKL
jgi:uncharacterized protein YcfL